MSDITPAGTAAGSQQRIASGYALIYDASCKVCGSIVARVAKWDRRGMLEIRASQNTEVAARFPWIPARAFEESLQLVRLDDGRTWAGAAALEELLAILPKGRALGWLFQIPFARGIADRCYRWFARNRYRIGCRDHCAIR